MLFGVWIHRGANKPSLERVEGSSRSEVEDRLANEGVDYFIEFEAESEQQYNEAREKHRARTSADSYSGSDKLPGL